MQQTYLTLVFPITSQEQQSAILAQPGWTSSSHDNAIEQRTNAEAVVTHLTRQLRDAQHELQALDKRLQEVGMIARENRSRAIVDLEVQISKLNFAIECYEKDLDAIKAALSSDKYPGSKDWREGCTLERIQWLHDMYAGAKEEVERTTMDVLNLQAMLEKANNQAEHFERHQYQGLHSM